MESFIQRNLGEYELSGIIYNVVQISKDQVRIYSQQIEDLKFFSLNHFYKVVEAGLLERVEEED